MERWDSRARPRGSTAGGGRGVRPRSGAADRPATGRLLGPESVLPSLQATRRRHAGAVPKARKNRLTARKDDESVPPARLIMGEVGHATGGVGRQRPDRAPGIAQDHPARGGRGERPAGVGGPGGGALPCGAPLGTHRPSPYPPLARPVCPAAGRTGPAVRGGEAARAAPRRSSLSGAGRDTSPVALARAQGLVPHPPGAGAGRRGWPPRHSTSTQRG